jgi:hypothetical protein
MIGLAYGVVEADHWTQLPRTRILVCRPGSKRGPPQGLTTKGALSWLTKI